jgi:hypothetical protein
MSCIHLLGTGVSWDREVGLLGACCWVPDEGVGHTTDDAAPSFYQLYNDCAFHASK